MSRPPSSARRHASAKPSLHHLNKSSSIRPSTAPSLSFHEGSGTTTPAKEFVQEVQNRPSLAPLTLSFTPFSPASTVSSPSNGYVVSVSNDMISPLNMKPNLPSPTSPDLSSTFSSSFSSVRSHFSDTTCTTVDTVTTSTMSNEGPNASSKGRSAPGSGRTRSNTNTMNLFNDFEASLSQQGFPNSFSTFSSSSTSPRQEMFAIKQSSLDYMPLQSSRSPSNDRGKAKMLLDMPLQRLSSIPHQGMTEIKENNDPFQDSLEEDDEIPDEVIIRGLEAQERLKTLRPAHSASKFIEDLGDDILARKASMDFSKAVNGLYVGGVMKKLPSCKRSFTAPPTILEQSSSAYPSNGNQRAELHDIHDAEDVTSYANRHISFSQSTYDLNLFYEGGKYETAFPLPSMSWFPEPPLSYHSSTSSSPLLQKGKDGQGKLLSSISSIPMGNWREIGRARRKIKKVSIGYPRPQTSPGN